MSTWERITSASFIGGDLEVSDQTTGFTYRGPIVSISFNGITNQADIMLEWAAAMNLQEGLLWSMMPDFDPYACIVRSGEISDLGEKRLTFMAIPVQGGLARLINAPARFVLFPRTSERPFNRQTCEGRTFSLK